MSLVNEALKRAKQAHSRSSVVQQPAAANANISVLQPVEDSPRHRGVPGGKTGLMILIPTLVLLVGLSGWLLWQWRAATETAQSPATALSSDKPEQPITDGSDSTPDSILAKEPSSAEVVSSVSTADADSTPADSSNQTASVAISSASKEDNALTTGSTATSQNESATVPPPNVSNETSPSTNAETVSLNSIPVASIDQGIFYRSKDPTALVDGRVLRIGDVIEGYRVEGIEAHSVKFSGPHGPAELKMY